MGIARVGWWLQPHHQHRFCKSLHQKNSKAWEHSNQSHHQPHHQHRFLQNSSSKKILRHGNKVINLIHHLVGQVTSQCGLKFALGRLLPPTHPMHTMKDVQVGPQLTHFPTQKESQCPGWFFSSWPIHFQKWPKMRMFLEVSEHQIWKFLIEKSPSYTKFQKVADNIEGCFFFFLNSFHTKFCFCLYGSFCLPTSNAWPERQPFLNR
jgi:hypothetical protein